MNNASIFPSRNTRSDSRNDSRRSAVISFAIVAAAIFLVPQAHAQQPKLAAPYSKAALQSLLAIESDDAIAQERDAETVAKIDEADERATTEQEASVSKTIREIYQLRLQDNKLMRAYGKLIEIESAQETSGSTIEQRKKDAALSQFADVQESIMRRQEGCFRELEQSLAERSGEDSVACSEWIQKAKASASRAASVSTHVLEAKTVATEPAR